MSRSRTFLGIAASSEIIARAEQVVTRLRRATNNVKWVERENLHWTLHFLGELDDQEIFEVCQAAERGAAEVAAFGLKARGVGAFPNNSRPRTLWLGAGQGGDDLVDLHDTIDSELRPLGFRGETRRYVPHLTLGRVGRGLQPNESRALAEAIAELSDFEAGAQAIDEVTLYASRLRREGPEYQVLGHVELG